MQLNTLYRQLFIVVLSFTLSGGFAQSQQDEVLRQHDRDSLALLVRQCVTDTCQFNILYTYFWRYAGSDVNRVRASGEHAYRIIMNSKNLQKRSDGYDIKGFLLENIGKLDSAALCFHNALNLARKSGYESRIRWSYYHLGIIYGRNLQPDSALFYFNALLKEYPDQSTSPSVFEVTRQKAFLFLDVYHNKDSALINFNNMLLMSRRSGNAQREIESQIYLMNYYNKTNQVIKLLGTMDTLLVLAEKYHHEKALINIYNMIGTMFLVNKKNYDLALAYYEKVLEICRPSFIHWQATILNDIGDVYLKMGNDSLAVKYVNAGLKIAQNLKFKHQLSESYRNFGKIYLSQGKYPQAIRYFEACYNTGCDQCSKVVFHSALIDIADAYMKLGNREIALHYLYKSLDLASEYNSTLEMAVSNFQLGNFYINLRNSSAGSYYLKALSYVRHSNNYQTIREIADTLSSFFSANNDYHKAYIYESLARDMEDSIIALEEQRNLADWELKFEIDKINKERSLKEQLEYAELNRQKMLRNAALIISLLFLILGFLIYSSYRRKKKDHLKLKKMSAELHETDEMKLRFFANVSHELRTPLTLILNPAKSLLENSVDDKERTKYIENIYSNAIRLRDLTNQIMDLQKLDAGKLKLCLEETDIVVYCVGIASSFESLCAKKKNRLVIHSNYRSYISNIDRDKTGKILSNLLANAFKFCFENSSIEFSMHIVSGRITFSIKDEGIGIPAEEINRTFLQFYQASTNQSFEGSGIGLAYVKELTSFMGGTVEIESIVRQGTRIKVSLPVTQETFADSSAWELILPQEQFIGSKEPFIVQDFKEGLKLALIVEDNIDLQQFIGDLLRPEYNLIFAANGIDGAERAFNYLPDIIISDVMMPGMNGFDLCEMLKKDERTSHIPIILLTARDGSQSNLEGYQLGADDYITKPFDNQLLRLKVRNITSTLEATRRQFDLKSIMNVDAIKIGKPDKDFMKKCLGVIENHLNDSSFSVDICASEMSFSNRNFYRKIKALTNQTPADLIRVYRLHYAKKLLTQTNNKVFEIAMAVGYEDVNRFRQAFKKQFGYPPSEVPVK